LKGSIDVERAFANLPQRLPANRARLLFVDEDHTAVYTLFADKMTPLASLAAGRIPFLATRVTDSFCHMHPPHCAVLHSTLDSSPAVPTSARHPVCLLAGGFRKGMAMTALSLLRFQVLDAPHLADPFEPTECAIAFVLFKRLDTVQGCGHLIQPSTYNVNMRQRSV